MRSLVNRSSSEGWNVVEFSVICSLPDVDHVGQCPQICVRMISIDGNSPMRVSRAATLETCFGDFALVETTDGSDVMNRQKHFSAAYI